MLVRARRYRGFIAIAAIVLLALYYFSTIGDWEGVRNSGVDRLKQWTGPFTTPSNDKVAEGEKPDDKDQKAGDDAPTASETGEPVPTDKPDIPSGRFGEFTMGGKGRHEAPPLLENKPVIHWSRTPEHFPVPTESLIPLPSGNPKKVPAIQYAFKKESEEAKADRQQKLDKIREAFKHTWKGYREKAWLHDELRPVSGAFRDPFCQWAATLVDTLDTLWIMGLEQDFKEAVDAINQLDFTTSPRKDIPVFETTIRYLGGLLAAYDVSGGKYDVLLKKAVELGDVLMGAFDTPNRLPIMYYYWRPTFATNPHRAGTRVVMAEIGSLSVEFTRLAQITKENRYYDAVARITNEFDTWQNSTKIPGLWPRSVDASGCRKPDVSDPLWFSQTDEEPILDTSGDTPATESTDGAADKKQTPEEQNQSTEEQRAKAAAESNKQQHRKRELAESGDGLATSEPMLSTTVESDKIDCEPQGLTSPPGATWEIFTLGGQADSTFEYLPKQYMLLGGLVPQYQHMYEMAADAANEYLIYRPMIPDDRNVLIAGSVEATDNKAVDKAKRFALTPEHTHLTCFTGGMFGIGAKIFDRKDDLGIAAKLTDGCVWAYEATETGIMPEDMTLIPCDDRASCAWNETRWGEALDPWRESREEQYRATQEARKEAAAEEAKKKPEAASTPTQDGKPAEQGQNPGNPPLENAPGNAAAGQTNPETRTVKRQLGSIENDAKVIQSQPEESQLGFLTANVEENEFPTHEEFIAKKIKEEHIPIGIPSISSKGYILRYGLGCLLESVN